MTLRKLSNTASPDEIANVVRGDGGVIIKKFLSVDMLSALTEDLLPLLEETPKGVDEAFAGNNTRRAGRLFARTKHVAEAALLPQFLEAARAVLQTPIKIWVGNRQVDTVPDIQIGVAQAIQIHPGQGKQPLHRDDSIWMWRHPVYGREARFQIMIAISEFTHENGATQVIPGSHRWDDERMPTEEEAVSAEMEAGDALMWIGSTYHGGGQNQSDTLRTGLTMAYDLAFLRQEENQYLSIPIAKLKTLPADLQRLLGWSSGATHMGWVEIDGQMRDPYVLLGRDGFTDRNCLGAGSDNTSGAATMVSVTSR